MSKRVNALVHEGMAPEEVAEVLGVPVEDYVSHGNGSAVITFKEQPAKKARKKGAESAQANKTAPQGDDAADPA